MCSTICSTVTLKCFCVLCFYNMVAFFPYQKIQSSLILYSSSLQGWWMVSMDLGWWHFVGIIHCIGGEKKPKQTICPSIHIVGGGWQMWPAHPAVDYWSWLEENWRSHIALMSGSVCIGAAAPSESRAALFWEEKQAGGIPMVLKLT